MDGEVLVLAAAAAWLGVLVATRSVLAGSLVAAGSSFAASAAIGGSGGLANSLLLGRGGWAVLAELLALGLLAGWSTRRLAPLPLGLVVVAMTVAVIAISQWRQSSDGDGFISAALVAGLAGCVGAGALLRQSDHEQARAAHDARRDERLAIARELHDVVAHHVTGMVVQAQAGHLVAASDPDRAAESLAAIERAGTEALTSMRRMVGALRLGDDEMVAASPTGAAPTAPAATLAELNELADHTEQLGLPVRLRVDVTGAPADVAQSVHRIVRESLTNASRHAVGATAVDVTVARAGDALWVSVVDDGRGVSSSSPGFGLVGMAERVHALGGRFEAGPRHGGTGWEVRASFPLGEVRTA